MPQDFDYDRFPKRKHPRLKQYDYATPNYYFITICTHDKQCIFGMLEKRSRYGAIAEMGILNIEKHFANVKVDKYVVMPNHIHMILRLLPGSVGVPVIVGQYKSFVTKQIRSIAPDKEVWQTSFHDHVIRSQAKYEKIWLYIEANPANWGADCFCTDTVTNQERKDPTCSAGS